MAYEPDTWSLGDRTFTSRFILGSGKFNLDLVEAAVRDAGAEIVTLAVRRANTGQDGSILDAIPEGVTLLPNTSGARTADEAVRIARLARAMVGFLSGIRSSRWYRVRPASVVHRQIHGGTIDASSFE